MDYYRVTCSLRYDNFQRDYIIKASNINNVKILGKSLASTEYSEPDPKIYIHKIDVYGEGDQFYKYLLETDNYRVSGYIKSDSLNSAKDIINYELHKELVMNHRSKVHIREIDVYDEDLLNNKEFENIEDVIVFWFEGDKINKGIFEDIDTFHNYANKHNLYYNCENTNIIKDNILRGVIYNKWRIIDYNDIYHKLRNNM